MSGWTRGRTIAPSIAYLRSPRLGARRRLPAPSWTTVASAFAMGVSLAMIVLS